MTQENLGKDILRRLDIKAISFRQSDKLHVGKSLISILVVGDLFSFAMYFFKSGPIHLQSL